MKTPIPTSYSGRDSESCPEWQKYRLFLKCILFLFIVPFIKGSSNKLYAQRLWGIEYQSTTRQTPDYASDSSFTSDIAFRSFNFDVSYGGYLKKEKENHLLLGTLRYQSLKAVHHSNDSEEAPTSTPFNYLSKLKMIHELGIEMLYQYRLSEKWEFNTLLTTQFNPGSSNCLHPGNYTSNLLFYLQHKHERLPVGIGSALYCTEQKLRALPLLSLAYKRNKNTLDFLLPLSAEFKHKVNQKLNWQWALQLNFGGIHPRFNNIPLHLPTPDYISTTELELHFGFDYSRKETNHYFFQLGYLYRNWALRANQKLLHSYTLGEGIFIRSGIYYAL